MSIQAATATAAVSLVAARAVRRRQTGSWRARRSSLRISDAVDGRRANEPSGSGRCSRAFSSAGPSWLSDFATWARPKRSSAAFEARTWP